MGTSHIKNLISTLNKLGLEYAFTGAFAVSYYGYPRISSDIDILIEKDKDKLLVLAKQLANKGYDVTDADVSKAIQECSHFPVFHKQSTFPYFDFKIACKTDETSALQNSIAINYHGAKCRIVSVEDLIIKKLEWNDIKDVEIMLARHKEINVEKLEAMAREKSVLRKLKELLEQQKKRGTTTSGKQTRHS